VASHYEVRIRPASADIYETADSGEYLAEVAWSLPCHRECTDAATARAGDSEARLSQSDYRGRQELGMDRQDRRTLHHPGKPSTQ
jgi:hypothetical protein